MLPRPPRPTVPIDPDTRPATAEATALRPALIASLMAFDRLAKSDPLRV